MSNVEDALTRTLGDHVIVSTAGDFNYCCPKCPDGDNNYHMGVAFDKFGGVFNCWRCGYKGKLKRLIRDLGLKWDDLNDPAKIPVMTDEDLIAEVEAIFAVNRPIDDTVAPAIFPEGYVAASATSPAKYKKYIKQRCSPKVAKDYELGVCVTGKFKGRIIIPFRDMKGALRYYTARAIRTPRSEAARKDFRKYLNPNSVDLNGVGKAQVLFGIDKVNKHTKVILVMEGAFDVLRFATYSKQFKDVVAVAICGKALSATQRGMLQRVGRGKEVVMMLDSDAACESNKYAISLMSVCDDVSVVTVPDGKDPGDMCLQEFKNTLSLRKPPRPPIIEDSNLLKFLEK